MEMPEKSVVVVCPNPRCGKEIEEPIFLTNLSVTPAEQYDACPHCFTKLEPKTPTVTQEEVMEKTVAAPPEIAVLEETKEPDSQVLQKVEDFIRSTNEPQTQDSKTSACPEDFGYLANRPKDAPIPQECLFCPKMVDCMLRAQK